jgi:hypothetical protein
MVGDHMGILGAVVLPPFFNFIFHLSPSPFTFLRSPLASPFAFCPHALSLLHGTRRGGPPPPLVGALQMVQVWQGSH